MRPSALEMLINGNFQNKTQQRVSKVIKSLELLVGRGVYTLENVEHLHV